MEYITTVSSAGPPNCGICSQRMLLLLHRWIASSGDSTNTGKMQRSASTTYLRLPPELDSDIHETIDELLELSWRQEAGIAGSTLGDARWGGKSWCMFTVHTKSGLVHRCKVYRGRCKKNGGGAGRCTLGQAGAPGTQCLVHRAKNAWCIFGAQKAWIPDRLVVSGETNCFLNKCFDILRVSLSLVIVSLVK